MVEYIVESAGSDNTVVVSSKDRARGMWRAIVRRCESVCVNPRLVSRRTKIKWPIKERLKDKTCSK